MRKVGIWIDQKEAHIITLSESKVYSKTIYSDIETRIRYDGEKKQFGRFGDQFLVDEKGKKNRIEEYTQRYLMGVLKELKNADEIVLFGPAQTKSKLEKVILNDPGVAPKLKAVKISDNMTQNQKIAYVKDFYKSKKS
jgi:hypothetical protein